MKICSRSTQEWNATSFRDTIWSHPGTEFSSFWSICAATTTTRMTFTMLSKNISAKEGKYSRDIPKKTSLLTNNSARNLLASTKTYYRHRYPPTPKNSRNGNTDLFSTSTSTQKSISTSSNSHRNLNYPNTSISSGRILQASLNDRSIDFFYATFEWQ